MEYLKNAIANHTATEFLQSLSDFELRCLYDEIMSQPIIGDNVVCYETIMMEITYRFESARLSGVGIRR